VRATGPFRHACNSGPIAAANVGPEFLFRTAACRHFDASPRLPETANALGRGGLSSAARGDLIGRKRSSSTKCVTSAQAVEFHIGTVEKRFQELLALALGRRSPRRCLAGTQGKEPNVNEGPSFISRTVMQPPCGPALLVTQNPRLTNGIRSPFLRYSGHT
jgi:hypothetical protein